MHSPSLLRPMLRPSRSYVLIPISPRHSKPTSSTNPYRSATRRPLFFLEPRHLLLAQTQCYRLIRTSLPRRLTDLYLPYLLLPTRPLRLYPQESSSSLRALDIRQTPADFENPLELQRHSMLDHRRLRGIGRAALLQGPNIVQSRPRHLQLLAMVRPKSRHLLGLEGLGCEGALAPMSLPLSLQSL